MDGSPKYKFERSDFMADKDAKALLTPDQYWELENKKLELESKKLENEITLKQMEITSAEKIATENNKVAAEANKVGLWANIVNGAKVVLYFVLGIIGLVISVISKRDDQAYELSDTYRAKESSKWSQKIFDSAMKRIENLKN